MNITPPSEKKTDAGVSLAKTTLNAIKNSQPLFEPVLGWLNANNGDPTDLVTEMLRRLAAQRRFLPPDQRGRYVQKIVLGEFMARWVRKHRGSTIEKLSEDKEVKQTEMVPFYWAIELLNGKTMFQRVVRRMARTSMIDRYAGSIGAADDFAAFVLDHGGTIAHRFLQHFNPDVPGAGAKAVRYMERTAVSIYLNMGMKEARNIAHLGGYLDKSTRMKARTKIAAKLAYLPSALTKDERKILRDQFGFDRIVVDRMPIQEIAGRLGFSSAGSLSRKLYRQRSWINNAKARAESEVTS